MNSLWRGLHLYQLLQSWAGLFDCHQWYLQLQTATSYPSGICSCKWCFVTYLSSVDSDCLLLGRCYHCVISVCWPEELVWWVLFCDQRAKNTSDPSTDVGERMGNSRLCWWKGALGMGEDVCGKVCCCSVVKGDGKRKAWERQWIEARNHCICGGVSCGGSRCVCLWSAILAGSVCHFYAWYLSSVCVSLAPSGLCVCMLLTWAVSLVFSTWGIRVRLC